MGLCHTENKKNNSNSIPSMLKAYTSNINLNNNLKRNDFYYFTEWIIRYKFYNKF